MRKILGNQNLGGLSITVTAADNSLQTVLPTLYNTALDKGYLDRHNRTFHASVVDTSGKVLGDWSGYFCGASTSIWGNAYGVSDNSTYQFISRSRGADAVLKKLGSPSSMVVLKIGAGTITTTEAYSLIICAAMGIDQGANTGGGNATVSGSGITAYVMPSTTWQISNIKVNGAFTVKYLLDVPAGTSINVGFGFQGAGCIIGFK